MTQFGRAMQELGVDMIAAYSPQARGRSERMFGTLQGRLPHELALRNITDIDSANRFLRDEFLPDFNARFSVDPIEQGSAFVPLLNAQIHDILCLKTQRIVNNDNCVNYKTKCLQIPKTANRCHYAKATVKVHEYQDGTMAIFHGPRLLGVYDKNAKLEQTEHQAKSKQAANG